MKKNKIMKLDNLKFTLLTGKDKFDYFKVINGKRILNKRYEYIIRFENNNGITIKYNGLANENGKLDKKFK